MTRWVSGSSGLCPGDRGRGTPTLSAVSPHVPPPHSSPVSRVVYNGKRNSSPRSPPSSSEIFTPAHEENVRFIYEGTLGTCRPGRPTSWSPPLPSRVGAAPHLPSPQGPGR